LHDKLILKCSDEIDPDYVEYLGKFDPVGLEDQFGPIKGGLKGKLIENMKKQSWDLTVTALCNHEC